MHARAAISGVVRGAARSARTLPDSALLLWRGLGLIASVVPGTVAIYLAIVFGVNMLPVLQVWLGKLIVDRLAAGVGPGAPLMAALGLAALYALTIVCAAVTRPVEGVLAAQLEDAAVGEIDRQVIEAGSRLKDLYRLERPAFGDELRLLEECSYRLPRLFWFVQHGVGNTVTLVGLLLLLGRLQPFLPVLLVAATAPNLFAVRHLNHLKFQAMARRSRAAREMDYCLRVTTEPAAAKEVRVFGLGDFFLRRFHERSHAALHEVEQLRLRELRTSSIFGAIHACALGGGFWYVATQAGLHRLTLGDVALYLGAITQAESCLFMQTAAFAMLHEILMNLRGLLRFLDGAGPSIALAPVTHALHPAERVESGIAMRSVSFRCKLKLSSLRNCRIKTGMPTTQEGCM